MADPVVPSTRQPAQPSVSPVNPVVKPGTMGTVDAVQTPSQTPSQIFPTANPQVSSQPYSQKLPQTSPIMPPVRPIPSSVQPLVQPASSIPSSKQSLAPQLPAEQPSTLLPKQTSTPQQSPPRPPVGTMSSMSNQGSQVTQKPVAVKPISPAVTPTPIRVTPASAGGSIFPGISTSTKTGVPMTTLPQSTTVRSSQQSITHPAEHPAQSSQSAQQGQQGQQPQRPQQSKQQTPPKEQPGFKPATPGDVKQSPFRFLPLVVGALLLVGGLWFIITRFFSGAFTPKTAQNATPNAPVPVKQTTLTYWGLWEPGPVLNQVIKDFQAQNPGVIINYIQQSPRDYRERLQDALQKGQGPDIFRYHATWVPMLKNQLSLLPSSVMSSAEFSQTFYPVAVKQLTTPNGIVGIPLMYDGLGLYYNKQMLQTANILPPTQWSDLETAAKVLTVRAKDKQISRAGVALGLTANVDNFSDILGLLILQNGGDPAHPSSKLVADTVKYYTNFNKILGVWNETLPNSTYAFATEKVAMMIAPSWRAFEVKAINPNLQFAIAPAPQLQGTSITWASYWVEGVSKTSKQQELSWKFLKYMSEKEVLQKLYSDAASKTPRLFGEIYPRVDMANTLAADPYVGAFVSDAPKASSWWMSSRTFDNGMNDKIIKYYQDAINTVNSGQGLPADVLKNTEIGVQQVLQQNP